LEEVVQAVEQVSLGQGGREQAQAQAQALHALARRSTARARAVAARSLVARTLARHLQERAGHGAERDAAIAELLHDDADGQRLQAVPGSGPQTAATIRAERGDASRFARVDEVVA
jgi:transposase